MIATTYNTCTYLICVILITGVRILSGYDKLFAPCASFFHPIPASHTNKIRIHIALPASSPYPQN